MHSTGTLMKQDDIQQNSLGLAEPVLVVGLGVTGLSCARFLSRHAVPFIVADSRQQPPGIDELCKSLPDVEIYTGEFNPALFNKAGTLIVSPGISIQQPLFTTARQNGANIIGDIELFAQQVEAPVIAVTGSNGKTTVTSLLGEMARHAGVNVQVGGNIGTPVLDLLEDAKTELYVLELSSFQLETTYSLDAVATTILNITEDHMDRYTGLDDYTAAKARIFQGKGTVIANLDDARVMNVVSGVQQRKCIGFSLKQPTNENYGVCQIDNAAWLCKGQQTLLPVAELRIKGTHNVANALAALAMGELAGLSMPAMLETLRVYQGLPHRMQWLAEHNGVNWFNDSKATNVGATVAAIDGFSDSKVILIAGGQGKGQDFAPLTEVLRKRVSTMLLLGEDAKEIARVIPENVNTLFVNDMQEAVATANSIARPGDIVLLSPACASFDMFNGYEQRGEVFMMAVREQVL